jgi:hypothetical protein
MTRAQLTVRAERAEKAINDARSLVSDARLRTPVEAKAKLEQILRILDRALNERQVETQTCDECDTENVPVLHASSFTGRRLCGVCIRNEGTERWSITPEGETAIADPQAVAS